MGFEQEWLLKVAELSLTEEELKGAKFYPLNL
jgi:hypothetical protein